MRTTPWGCPPDTSPDEAVVFHGDRGLIFHSLSTTDETVIREAVVVARDGGDLLAWAERCLKLGVLLSRHLRDAA